MLQKIKSLIVITVTTLAFGSPVLVPAVMATTGTASADIQSALCNGVNTAAGSGSTSGDSGVSGCDAGGSTTSLSTLAAHVVNILSLIVGIAAVIMIIVGGFRYITSGGESGNVSGAKNTLIYAIVGLIIVALAQFIVHYVLNAATSNTLSQ